MAFKRGTGKENRSSFLWHPKKEVAEKIEYLCAECDMSANALISELVGYALERATLKPRMVQMIEFKTAENKNNC